VLRFSGDAAVAAAFGFAGFFWSDDEADADACTAAIIIVAIIITVTSVTPRMCRSPLLRD
jgi:hypothetical protein